MNFLEQLYLIDALHVVSQVLIIPTVTILLLLIAYCVYTIGALVVEIFTERKRYKVAPTELIAKLDAAEYGQLDTVIRKSGLLDTQRHALQKLVSYMYLPEDALTEVAKRLLADESKRYRKALGWTDTAMKIGPMLGLMGTLIPLGPGILALGSGDLETLSTSLLTAFDTTVAGLLVAVVCLLIGRIRRRWYEDYLKSVEGAMNTLLEKAELLHKQDFDFARAQQSEAIDRLVEQAVSYA